MSVGSGTYKCGDSASGGIFGNLGLGAFGGFSTRTNKNLDTSVSVSIGGGAGIAGGAQACMTRTVCFN